MKSIIILNICIMLNMTSCAQSTLTYDKGVVINGVKWATRNVDEVGTFAPTPESTGKFYQWNRKKSWNITGEEVIDWDSTTPEGKEWEKINDPSPFGWRVPTFDEMNKLLDINKVSNERVTINNVTGIKFSDKSNGNTLFLPIASYRYYYGGSLGTYSIASLTDGGYWCNTQSGSDSASSLFLYFHKDIDWASCIRSYGFSVRCVAE